MAVAALVVLVLLAVAAAGSSPRVCGSCHAGQTKALAATSHKDVSCYSCHLRGGMWGMFEQKRSEFLDMYPLTLLGGTRLQEPAAPISSSACLSCHAEIRSGVSEAAGLRIKHETCAATISCDACHAMTAHGTAVRWQSKPVMDRCIACHRERQATVKCESCHVERNDAKGSAGPWQVTHGRNWEKMHGMGDLDTCRTCHDDDFCKRCHGVSMPHGADFGATHAVLAKKDSAACMKCHRSSAFCNACHGIQMPHPAGFLEQHTKIAKGTEDTSCTRCHVPEDCRTCHDSHVHPGGASGVPHPKQHSVRR